MTIIRRLITISAVTLLLAGCASSPAAPDTGAGGGVRIDPDVPAGNIAADGEVLGQGTVLQIDGETPQLCLGAVMESYPPQCTGAELVGWDWASTDGHESANGVTWGTYAAQGTWDGEHLTITQPPIMLALYDPMMLPDPLRDPSNIGSTSEADLLRIQTELHEADTVEVLVSGPENGYLFATVVYDDGQVQRYFDEVYGSDVVVVESALRPVAR